MVCILIEALGKWPTIHGVISSAHNLTVFVGNCVNIQSINGDVMFNKKL